MVVVCLFGFEKEIMADSRKSLTPVVKQIGLYYNRTRISKYWEKYSLSPQTFQEAKQT